uniref:Uncharacterized protein n=1 Tax=Solanum lycopersicum TaxID=4081 RepID=A0A3Q7FIS5_SOLLC
MDLKRPFSDAFHGSDTCRKGGNVFLMDIRGIIKFLLHLKIKRKPPLLIHMGDLRSREYRLGCAMHSPHFRYGGRYY